MVEAENGTSNATASAQMPMYQCHKKVRALKIAKLTPAPEDHAPNCERTSMALILTPEDTRFSPFKVDSQYVAKHTPKEGGYYVVYEDGYKSFSPAKAFEEGYTQLDAAHQEAVS